MTKNLQLLEAFNTISSTAPKLRTALKKLTGTKCRLNQVVTNESRKKRHVIQKRQVHDSGFEMYIPSPKPTGREDMGRHWRLLGELDTKAQDEFIAILNSTTQTKAQEARRLQRWAQKQGGDAVVSCSS